jgi:hypothetical protein
VGWHYTSTRYCGHFWPIVQTPDDRGGWLWSNWWNEDWQRKPKHSEKICPSATLSTTNPTWPDPGSNPGRRGGKPATNRLSNGAVQNNGLIDRMIGFISNSATTFLNYSQYSDNADLNTIQFTVAHALGFSIFTSRFLATDHNTETSTSKHYEVLLPLLVQSLWNSTALCWTQNRTSRGCLLPRTHLNGTALKTEKLLYQ